MKSKKTHSTERELLNFDALLFGITGDLSARKLIPALFERYRMDTLHPDCRFIGLARQSFSNAEFKQHLSDKARIHLHHLATDDEWESFISRWHYICVETLYGSLNPISPINSISTLLRNDAIRVVYLATPPHLIAELVQLLANNQLLSPHTRLVIEKPLGTDLNTAKAINQSVLSHIPEHQIYRIDHYLGKESVQNVLALRFGNILFEPLWRREWISDVQITVAEDIGVGEHRASYYNGVGALKDMVQSHLLQLLAMVTMEAPISLNPDAIRDEKLKVFKSLKPIVGGSVAHHVVRGQYTGYQTESAITKDSQTETFVALKIEIDNWRWAGVPFYLRTGKCLAHKCAEIIIRFKPLPTQLLPLSQFNEGYSYFDKHNQSPHLTLLTPLHYPNQLHIKLQPDEGLSLSLMSKKPGDGMRLSRVHLALDFDEAFVTRRMEAYERLLTDVVRGNLALFTRTDELEATWAFIDPIVEAWNYNDIPLYPYESGSYGPMASNVLINRDGLWWNEQI